MATITVHCPHCRDDSALRKHGRTDTGTPRARCMHCNKTFALAPKSRAVTAEKEAAILRHLEERTSIRGICRALRVSPNTVYKTLKKSREPVGL